MKRVLSLLLTVCLLTGIMPISARADGLGGMTVTQAVKFQKVSMGGATSCAIDQNGALWIWNLVDYTDDKDLPVRAERPQKFMEDVKDVSAGYLHVVALKKDGTVWTWGSGFDGRLGDGSTEHRYTPKQIMSDVKAIAAGFYHSFAIKNDGSLWGWGENNYGQLGDGTTENALSPKKISDDVIAVAAGEHDSLFIKSDHSLWGMGDNLGALLGSLSFDKQLTPKRVESNVSAACCYDGLLMKTDGSAWEFGFILDRESPQYGSADSTRNPVPQKVLDGVSSIATGRLLRFAVKNDGTLWAWGSNWKGQLGDGTNVYKTSPEKVMDHVLNVSTNGYSCLAVKTDGTLWAWGLNDQGQLGDGTTTDRLSPVQITVTETVEYPTPFYDVPAGAYYADAVLWAVNHTPQITNGTGDDRFSPDDTCTRAQVVTFLWRAMGEPEPETTTNPFADVTEGAYYYKAVLWANENDITNGTGDGNFSPDAGCTRGQVVTFLWRAEGKPAASESASFHDVPAGQFYTDAVTWAVGSHITNGTGDSQFSPTDTCTRGQIVTFLHRDMG